MNSFRFSVIIPVYNTEPYLEECFDSVIRQTIGFEHIQMILVNDGSTDGSDTICQVYAEKHPDNILYLKQENKGVSAARNLGLEHVRGEFVTFLDSDDKWGESAFQTAWELYEKWGAKTDVIAAPTYFFDRLSKPHAQNYRFEKNARLVDLWEEKNKKLFQNRVTDVFIRMEAVGDLRFDESLHLGEDSKFIIQLLLKKMILGLFSNREDAAYLYRKREAANSAVDIQIYSKDYYLDVLRRYHLSVMQIVKNQLYYIPGFIQTEIAYDLMYRLGQDAWKEVLSPQEQQEFSDLMHQCLNMIDDTFILLSPIQAHRTYARREEAYALKYGRRMAEGTTYQPYANELRVHNTRLFNFNNKKEPTVQITEASIENGSLKIGMTLRQWLLRCVDQPIRLALHFGDQTAYPVPTDHVPSRNKAYFAPVYNSYYCEAEFPLERMEAGEKRMFQPVLEIGNKSTPLVMGFGKFVANSRLAFRFYGDCVVKCYPSAIYVCRPKSLLAEKLKRKLISFLGLVRKNRPDLIWLRLKYDLFKMREQAKGKIWLISDRIENAGDNGECFFQYICTHKPEGIRPIFVIGKDANPEAIQRLRTFGEVVFPEDKKYSCYYCLSEKIISSGAGDFIINPLGKDWKYLADKIHTKFYFLNHGVNCGNCANWLNKCNKNIHTFFTTNRKERQAILEDGYHYSEDQVVVTGLPRFDALYTDTKKQLLILPSWRKTIERAYMPGSTVSVYFDGFRETEFFKFYNGLINHPRLLEAMRKYGYHGLFCLHPIFCEQWVDFEGNDCFAINEGFVDYNKVFAESAAMVTDYSTIAFDFAYLNKPILYAQFDAEEFFAGQTYEKGFFDYETMGFGPICGNAEEVVDHLIDLMKNDCKNPWIDRDHAFFTYQDQNNCKRVLDYLLEEDKRAAAQV